MARYASRGLLLVLCVAFAASCGDDPAPGSGVGVGEADGGDNDELDAAQDAPSEDTPSEDTPDEDAPDEDALGCAGDEECDDGLFCNGVERCSGGVCFASPVAPCADPTDCTVDRCDEENDQCVHVPDDAQCPTGQVCDPKAGCFARAECVRDEDCNDGLHCNGQEACVDERCQPGEPPRCDDGVECTSDLCLEETQGCQHTAAHDRCLPTELCALNEGCVPRPPCVRDDECDDGLFCNGQEACDPGSGQCVPGAAPIYNDNVGCTVDACSDVLGQVVHTPSPARCNDGLYCNGAELCHPTEGCQEGEPLVLSDGVDCTVDGCDEDLDFITHEPEAARCDDGLFCNGAEVCHPEQGCAPGDPPDLSDGVGCTLDTCSELERTVLHVPQDGACDDGLYCNGAETCDEALGCLQGEAPTLDDGVDCTVDGCDERLDQVTHAPDDGACDDGLFCDGAERCEPGVGCAEGAAPVLEDGVACTTDACDEEADRVVHAPDDGACSNDLFCDGAEVCDEARGCVPGVAPTLSDGVGCTVDACDEVNDRVTHAPNDAACDDALYCNGAEVCDALRDCQRGQAPRLDDEVPCTTDACDEANDRVTHTPNHAVCDDGLYCDGDEACAPEAVGADARGCLEGVAPVVTDDVACTVDTCDEASDQVLHDPSACECVVDADCQAQCQEGRCVAGECAFAPARVGTPCDDGVGCTLDDACDAEQRCGGAPTQAACDDGLFCNGAEACVAGVGCMDGQPPTLNDGVGCTVDACDEVNDRVTHAPLHARCDDALYCNGAETCDLVRDCVAGTPPVVTDNITCTTDACDEANDRITHTPNNNACSNGLFCDGAEVCSATLGCQAGAPPVITDNIPCTTDACDEANDRITHAPNNAVCSNGLFCDGTETCSATQGCLAGAPPTLTDNVPCTTDACDEANDRILHTPNNNACSNGLFCDGAEVCDVVRDCIAGTPPTLTDNIPCTTDACDEANDRVLHAPNNAACSNGLFCDGAETCSTTQGCLAGVAPTLTDNIPCTTDACDEANDRITHTPNNAACSNGLFCDGAETCSTTQGCQAGTPPTLTDNVPCTADACDEANDRVLHTPNNAACSNGLFCDGAEVCDAVRDCVAGTPPTLTDNIPCTTDTCDEANDRITHTPNNAACGNGLFCDGAETCSATLGCQAGTPPNLEDGLPCTDGTCNEATDAVVQTPIHARCADANVCDGAEQCVVGVGCQEGTPLSQGAVCVADPRSLCLNNACSLSRCGDMYVDAARGEQCDDGNMNDADACRNDCTNNATSYNYNGTFGILPDLSYTCVDGLFGNVAVDYRINAFVFAVSGGSLTAQLTPGGKPFTTLPQRTSQAQTPAPTNGSFSLRWFFSGGGFGCDETYTLAGAFTDANTWQATFTRTYVDTSGLGLCGSCADGSTSVRGTRQ